MTELPFSEYSKHFFSKKLTHKYINSCSFESNFVFYFIIVRKPHPVNYFLVVVFFFVVFFGITENHNTVS